MMNEKIEGFEVPKKTGCRVLHLNGSGSCILSSWLLVSGFFFAVRCAFLGLAMSISRIKTSKPQNNESNAQNLRSTFERFANDE